MIYEKDITEFMSCSSIFTKFALPLTWVQPEHGQEYLPICNHLPYLQKHSLIRFRPNQT